jgi:signal peptidase II
MRWAFALVGTVVVVADQATKHLVVSRMARGESIPLVADWLRITHVRNPGAAFGLFRGATGFLVLAALVGVAVFVFVIVRHPSPVTGTAAALVASGAFGNLADRAFRPWPFQGQVVDFIDLSFWPTFNVADIAISVGAGLLIITGFTEPGRDTDGDAHAEDRDLGS